MKRSPSAEVLEEVVCRGPAYLADAQAERERFRLPPLEMRSCERSQKSALSSSRAPEVLRILPELVSEYLAEVEGGFGQGIQFYEASTGGIANRLAVTVAGLCVSEIAGMLNRYASTEDRRSRLAEMGALPSMARLLHRDCHPLVQRCALETAVQLTRSPGVLEQLEQASAQESFKALPQLDGADTSGKLSSFIQHGLQLLLSSEWSLKQLAAQLLDQLLRTVGGRQRFRRLQALPLVLNQLRVYSDLSGGVDQGQACTWLHLLMCCKNLARDHVESGDQWAVQELLEHNALAVILRLVRACYKSHDANLRVVLAALDAITQMCMDDECALKLRLQADGFVALGALMLELSPSLGPLPLMEDDVEGSFECQARDVQRAAARLLRFLFAVERNRKAFKHIFAVEKLLVRFVDIGNYVWSLEAYDSFLEVLNGLTEKELTFLHTRFGRYRDYYSKGRDMPTLAVPQPKTADGTNSPTGFREGTRDEWDCERVIAGYELVECVGSGAFGRVHLARRADMPGDFAVKEIPLSEVTVLPNPAQHECTPKAHSPQHAPQEVVAEDINLEVHLLRQLDHPNVVRYFTSFITGAGPASTLWIVMEFCSGVPLQALTASAKEKGLQKLPEQQAWRIFVQICLALRYLHIDKRIAHRDLSPNNVLVQSHSLAVKVTDFGLARQKGGAASLMKSMVGTILYCSPEIVQHRPYTNKVDVWALGCLLYRMATLRDPFTGGNPISVARKIVECDYERLGSEHSQLMQVTCEECLAVDPEKRPGIEEVCQLITPAFMQQLEAVQRNMTSYWGSDMQTMQGSHYTGTSVWEDGSVQGRCTPTESPSPRTPSELSCPTPGPGGKNLVRVPRRALRTVTDPAQKAMAVVHRLAFLGHLPGCDDSQDSHHWAVCRYQEWLFSSPSHAAILKREVTRLMQRSADLVECRDTFGQPPLRGSAGADVATLALTYEQLYQYVIRVSSFYGYSCVPETGPPLSSMPSVGSHNSAS